jgi:hypothetical protein
MIVANSNSGLPVRFAGSELNPPRHICAFLNSPEEEYRVLLPFIMEGFQRGEKAFHVVDPKLREAHVERLTNAGIDVDDMEKNGQLTLCNWNEAYFSDGRFSENRMLAIWEDELEVARQRGFF